MSFYYFFDGFMKTQHAQQSNKLLLQNVDPCQVDSAHKA